MRETGGRPLCGLSVNWAVAAVVTVFLEENSGNIDTGTPERVEYDLEYHEAPQWGGWGVRAATGENPPWWCGKMWGFFTTHELHLGTLDGR